MEKTRRIAKNFNRITVLSAGSNDEDSVRLSTILALIEAEGGPLAWNLEKCPSLASALGILRKSNVPIILCERDIEGGSWKDMLEYVSGLPDPPCLIVTSRLADEHLWSEALNLGAYDVLSKPFEAGEVIRVLQSAWLHRQHRAPQSAKSIAASAPMNWAFPV